MGNKIIFAFFGWDLRDFKLLEAREIFIGFKDSSL
jgi:hypothetical protein